MPKKKAPRRNGSVWHATSEEATLARKPYYNAYVCGYGVHGDTTFNRAREMSSWRKSIAGELAGMNDCM